MAKVEDCPGFETFGADVKAARKARRLARKALAEMVGIEWRYLANEERNGGCLKTILCFLLFARDAEASFIFCTFFRRSPYFAGSLRRSGRSIILQSLPQFVQSLCAMALYGTF